MKFQGILEKIVFDPILNQVEPRLEAWAESRRQNFRPPLGSDIQALEHYRDNASKCVRCGICRATHLEKIRSQKYADNCPAGTRYQVESYFASGRHEIIRALLAGEIPITDRLVHVAYTCTSCGNCQENCNPVKDLLPLNAGLALREYLVEKGYGPLKEHDPLVKSILNYDNPWMQPRKKRGKWAKKMPLKDLTREKAEVLLFVGCTGSYDPRFKDVAPSAAQILLDADVDVGILGEGELCCGSTISRVGDRKNFETVRTKSVELLNSLGVKTIITACAGCHSTFGHSYEGMLDAEVMHMTEYMARLVEEGRLSFRREVDRTVTYHDPCHIGRYSRIFDAPRTVLHAIPGLKFQEMERIRQWSYCCGAGGGAKTAYPDYAQWVAQQRLQEAVDTGAGTLVSACPFCENNLGDAAVAGNVPLEVVDIMALVGEAMHDEAGS